MNKEKTLKLLKEAEDAYYNGPDHIMTDAEYDELYTKAKKEWPDDKRFQKKRIGAKPKSEAWKVVKHKIPMGSIENVPVDSKNSHVEDVLRNGRKWWISIGQPELILQHKVDGLSINQEFETGSIMSAILRGDGIEGEDIFKNVLCMQGGCMNAPEEITNIRAEIVLPKIGFKNINDEQAAMGDKLYANCRNAASGISRRLDGGYVAYLSIVAFDIVYPGKVSDTEAAEKAQKMGINFVESVRATTWEQVERFYKFTIQERDDLYYDIDGIVVKANLMADRERIGGDEMLPNWIRALKFPPEEKSFKVDEIRWFIGKTGKATPVLHNYAGVQFQAKVVNDVTLHNYAYFCQYKIAPGDKISVAISGDVIPQIEDVLERSGNPMFTAPKTCPECGSLLRVDETFLYCGAEGCPGRVKAIINSHIKEMGIEEVGIELVHKLYTEGKAGLIKFYNFPDLYTLTIQDIMKLDGYQEPSAKKVVENIQKRKATTLPVLIGSLAIPSIGAKTIKKLNVSSVDEIMKMSIEKMKAIPGIGAKTAFAIKEGVDKNYRLIGELFANGVSIKEVKKEAVKMNDILKGKSYCFTGDLKERNVDTGKPYERSEAQALVIQNGGVVKSGVSKKLDVLVLADMGSGSSKARKAREYGCETISSKEFFKRVGVL